MMKKVDAGWGIIVLSTVIPVVLWLFTPNPGVSTITIQTLSAALGELFGIVGVVLFSLNLILATRLGVIERIYHGLNKVYAYHNILGQLGLILLLFHPLLLLPRYASSIGEAAAFLFISDVQPRNFGILSLWIMVLLITLTLYLRPKYHIWNITHKFLGAAFFLGALHAYLIPSFVMSNVLVRYYVLGFALLGIVAFIYRTLLGRWLVRRYKYTVAKIQRLSGDIMEITLTPVAGAMQCTAGQFIFVSFVQKGISSESHPFSISANVDGALSITVKNLGDYTDALYSKLVEGASAKIEGPFGVFSYTQAESKKQIWIAGGIGITPFLNMARAIIDEAGYEIDIYYCVRDASEAVYLDLLKSLQQGSGLNQIRLIPFYSTEYGYITADIIQQTSNGLTEKDIFICAPPAMIDSVRRGCLKLGVKKERIYSEEFNF